MVVREDVDGGVQCASVVVDWWKFFKSVVASTRDDGDEADAGQGKSFAKIL